MIQYFPIVTGSLTVLGNINVSGSITTSGSITISGSITSASFASTASYWSGSIVNAESASFSSTASFVALAQSASNAVAAATASFANAFTVAGNLTAQTIVVQTITSSVIYSSGSNVFGNNIANTQIMTGSVTVTGSLAVVTNGTEFQVTSTGVNLGNALTDTHTITGSVGISGSLNANNTLYVSSSNVGIGIVPQELLHITGSSPAIRIGGARTYLLQIVDTDGRFRIHDNTAGERFTIASGSGNVGIGTISPLDKLDVAGTIRATVNTSYFTTFGYTGGTQIRMVSPIGETADNMVFKIDGASSSTTGNQFIFQTQSGNTTPVTTLWISKLGDVNIGTTTSTKYQVLNLINDANTVGAAIGLARSAGQFITNAGAGDLIIGNATGKNILFGNTGAGTTEYARITSGGNVTIGTNAVPSGATEFNNGSLFTSNNIFVNNSSGTAGYAVRIDGYSNNLYVLWSTAAGADNGGVGLAYGATSWSPVSSDARTKKNFETTQGLAEILQIEPIKYHLLSDEDNAVKRLGFKAQNLEPLIPEMVHETGKKLEDGSDILTITPDYILPVLVKAIQELNTKFEEYKATHP